MRSQHEDTQQSRWQRTSLAVWVVLGMALAVLPLAASAVVNHLYFDRAVLSAFDDVSTRYRDQIAPTQRLQVLLWEAAVPVDEYLDSRAAEQRLMYRELRVEIEQTFSRLPAALDGEPELIALLQQAAKDWQRADAAATQLLASPGALGDPEAIVRVDHFNAVIAATADKVRALDRILAEDLETDHRAANLSYERSRWLAGICGALSLLFMALGLVVISRIMLVTVSRLVQGARRFAAGDRSHRIEITVPPELRDVADEFNRMIGQIEQVESALAAQARRDALTGLPNRRAFDLALSEAFARKRRFGEPVVLLTFDIDHFKCINDTHGHSVGDAVLRVVGQTLAASVREVDHVFRVGGEEFAALLSGTEGESSIVSAERIRAAVAATPVRTEGKEISVTTSIGIAHAEDATTADELIREADGALYAAKAQGRNRVVLARQSLFGQAAVKPEVAMLRLPAE